MEDWGVKMPQVLDLLINYIMNKFNDNSPKSRLLRILKGLLERPCHFTVSMLAMQFNVSKDTIKKDFEELRNADFEVMYDEKYRYYIEANKAHDHLEELLFFTETEKEFLLLAIENSAQITEKRLKRMHDKLNAIYDVSKLGSSLFSRTFLQKVDLLEQAKQQKRVVQLINYRSTNSAEISTRTVEAFMVSTKEDILHCFDLDRGEIRHFRVSRVERVEVLTTLWAHETRHAVTATDPFRIANNRQVHVHIKLRVGGYNELTERFPLTQAYLKPANEAGVFDFECKVNEQFYGLTNFILGYHEHIVEIVEPDRLVAHIQTHVKKINF
jgi:predicted DNA-binding transcriptional regulator YafY